MYDFADADIDQACSNYLQSLGYTMWANWDINQENRRKLAVNWLSDQFKGVLAELDKLDQLDLTIATAPTRRKAWAARWQKHSTLMKSSAVYRFSKRQLQRLHAALSSAATRSSAH